MKRPIVAALALVALILCLAAFWGLQRRRAEPAPIPNPSGEATIEFLDVGQGDSILIRSPEGKAALVDAGPSNRIVGLLQKRGVKRLDLVVVSHHHQDHYGGMGAVIGAFRPRVFLDADSPHVTANYLSLLRKVKEAGITAIRPGPEERKIELGSVLLRVFPEAPRDEHEENNNSVGIRVEFGRFSALLTGDSEVKERRWWLAEVPSLCDRVDVLKLAHHGSRNGTDAAWLGTTRPKVAVASLGLANEFGHPHAETLRLLRADGIPLARTDRSGSIRVKTDGLTFSVEPPPDPAVDPGPLRNDRGRRLARPPARRR